MARLELLVGGAANVDAVPLQEQCQTLGEDVRHIRVLLENHLKEAEDKEVDWASQVVALKEEFQTHMQEIHDELVLLKRAAVAGPLGGREGHSKVRIPEPKPYDGARVAKDLENFLWDMEQYFKAAHIEEREQVSITSMYLVGDAKLWWRTRTDGDASADRPEITTFEALKKELKEQFLPLNSSWLARENLRNLKQTGNVRDYVKEFSSLLLDIKNMSDDDKLFNFLAGLKPWAQAELRRQAVKDLPTAVAAADSLVDFKQAGPSNDVDKGKGNGKNHKVEGRDKKAEKRNGGAGDTNKTGGQTQGSKDFGCFICGGPHMAKFCPRKERLNALLLDEDKEGNEDENETVTVKVNPMRLVTLRTETSVQGDGLMYVKALVNGREVMALVDTGATNSFIAAKCAKELGLKLVPSSFQIKTANSTSQQICGTSNVGLKVGEWRGNFKFNIVTLDDFDCILGMDFLVETRSAVIMHLGGIMMENESCPCFVKAVPMKVDKGKQKVQKLGAAQVWFGDMICDLHPRKGESSQLGGKLQKFQKGPKSLSPKDGDASET